MHGPLNVKEKTHFSPKISHIVPEAHAVLYSLGTWKVFLWNKGVISMF